MAKLLQLRGGTTSQHSSFTGAVREVTVDTDKDVVVVHDGSTAGGFPSVKSGGIVNADINASAAIATSKISGAATSIASHGLATSATTDTTNASNIASGTLPDARLNAGMNPTLTTTGKALVLGF